MDDDFSVDVRPATPGDTAYISKTWLQAARPARMDRARFLELHRPVIAALLARGASVAHPAGDPETILGFVVAEPGVLHWLYVRDAWRGNGIARRLYAAAGSPVLFTHWSSAAAGLVRRDPALVYYPYLARG